MPTVGVEGKQINVVPVDFVAEAMDHIAHRDGLDGQAFHLTDPNPLTAGQLINLFARAAHAPQMRDAARPEDARRHPAGRAQRTDDAAAGQADHATTVLGDLGIPRAVLIYVNYPTKFDSKQDAGGARGLRHRGAAARDLRRQALGLLGAQPRPRPVQGPLARAARSAARS